MNNSSDISPKWFSVALLAAFALAFVLRVGVTAAFQGMSSPQGPDMGLDPIDYENFAYQMSIGNGYALPDGQPSARRTPGTSLALLPTHYLFGRNFFVGRVWWCVLSSATVVATGILGSMVASRKVGALAAVLLSVYPGHLYCSMHFLSEVPFALLAVGAAAFEIAANRRSSYLLASVAGVLCGLAILTRGQLVLAMPIAAVLVVATQQGRQKAAVYMVLLGSVVLVLAPWVLRNKLVFGKATMALILSSHTFWGAHNDVVFNDPAWRGRWSMDGIVDAEHPLTGSEVEREAAAWRYSRLWLDKHWSDMPMLTGVKLLRLIAPFEATGNRAVYWSYGISWICVAPFFAMGCWQLCARDRPAAVVLFLPLAATVISTIIFYGCVRFRDSVSPFILIFAAFAMIQLLERVLAAPRRTAEDLPSKVFARA